jgi:hypothetical protein
VQFAKNAKLAHVLVIERGPDEQIRFSHDEIVQELSVNAEDAYGFPPYPIIGRLLYEWDGQDLHEQERAIVSEALKGCESELIRSATFGWWKSIPKLFNTISSEKTDDADHSLTEFSYSSNTAG